MRRSDLDLEYKHFKNFLDSRGIQHNPSAGYCAEQNGFIERENRTSLGSARSMLYSKNLPSHHPGRTCQHWNLCIESNENGTTPYEKWYRKKPNISHIHPFGIIVYVHIAKGHRTKFQPKATKAIFVGYQKNCNNYRIYDPNKRRVFVARDMIFDIALTRGDLNTGPSIKFSEMSIEQISHQ